MENLLEAASDIDLDYPDEDGRTPLLLAALHDRADAARFLLARARTPRLPALARAARRPARDGCGARPRRHHGRAPRGWRVRQRGDGAGRTDAPHRRRGIWK